MLKSICALFCGLIIFYGCAKTTKDFFIDRYPVEAREFARGYEDGIALAKTEGVLSISPKDVPTFMTKIIETETESYQKGFFTGYRDRKIRNNRVFWTLYWTALGTVFIVLKIVGD